jgi:hypothetical protein
MLWCNRYRNDGYAHTHLSHNDELNEALAGILYGLYMSQVRVQHKWSIFRKV